MSPVALLKVASSSIGLQLILQPYPVTLSLIATSCSSVQYFALDFLQIPPHSGHPCPRLMVPTTTAHRDSHRLANTHAHENKQPTRSRCELLDQSYLIFPISTS